MGKPKKNFFKMLKAAYRTSKMCKKLNVRPLDAMIIMYAVVERDSLRKQWMYEKWHGLEEERQEAEEALKFLDMLIQGLPPEQLADIDKSAITQYFARKHQVD